MRSLKPQLRSSSTSSSSSVPQMESKERPHRRTNGRKEKSVVDSGIADETEEVLAKHLLSDAGFNDAVNDQSKFEVYQDTESIKRFLPTEYMQGEIDERMITEMSSTNVIPSNIFGDRRPIVINKPSLKNIVYQQQIRIRYLQPPTPPPPGPIIIKEKRAPMPPPLPPLIIRQNVKQPATPPPLIVRERPPTPPKLLKPVVIEKRLPAPPVPPRQVIIERINPPRKPRTIVFEKWLPYKKPKRPIILQRAAPLAIKQPAPNMVIEYSRPTTVSLPEYRVEGIFKVDPLTHTYSKVNGQLKIVDKIYDLPPPSINIRRATENFVDIDQSVYGTIYDDVIQKSSTIIESGISAPPY